MSPLRPPVLESAFVGRIGGNQGFVASDEAQLKQTPDAAPLLSVKDALRLNGFLQYDLWRMAFIEGWGTCLLIFSFGAGASGLTMQTQSQFASTLYAALFNVVGLTLFIYSAGPASGGHLNPTITMSTFFAGLCTFPRMVLYVSAQCTGAVIGSYWLRLGLGDDYFPHGVIPGCTVDPTLVSPGQLFVLEYMFAQALIFTAFGVGLDPRQGKVFGPALSPVLVGLTLAFGTLASSLAKPGYTGVCAHKSQNTSQQEEYADGYLAFNSARCLGLMVAKGDFQYHYVHWLATIGAAALNGLFYFLAPPYLRSKPLSASALAPHV
ncbi:hypothetical protein LTR78_006405 [Recurvomyces mirabilis]|uniref:Aquaporin-like protein n=1 Tax=Recurvomyces mirabilis TaxID=574656 RepID=A0AAE1C080_9PEZI|nr:hypothetical protein LTR78_006405 [Recurvomyces mirabilis]KAK5152292.1 hypothetical protein LTS14_008669 [Recurvomyces mirabilis]